jgi:hypothetical protein
MAVLFANRPYWRSQALQTQLFLPFWGRRGNGANGVKAEKKNQGESALLHLPRDTVTMFTTRLSGSANLVRHSRNVSEWVQRIPKG